MEGCTTVYSGLFWWALIAFGLVSYLCHELKKENNDLREAIRPKPRPYPALPHTPTHWDPKRGQFVKELPDQHRGAWKGRNYSAISVPEYPKTPASDLPRPSEGISNEDIEVREDF